MAVGTRPLTALLTATAIFSLKKIVRLFGYSDNYQYLCNMEILIITVLAIIIADAMGTKEFNDYVKDIEE